MLLICTVGFRVVMFILVGFGLVISVGSAEICTDLSKLRGIQIQTDWWDIRPYGYKADESINSKIKGIFPKLLSILENKTGILINYNQPFSSYSNFTKTVSKNHNSSILFPIMDEDDTRSGDECYISLVNTNGPAYFIHIKEIVPLELLGKGLLQGWQVIALTVVLAAISGVFIWLVDRKSNPEDFPEAFFPGIWQGFWWAFVTMTTVGYGDTAPRSILARLYCVLWMIIGMIAFSVLTANITSSLSRQTFDSEEKLFGKKVGVLKDTMDVNAAMMENANVNNFDSMEQLLSSMKQGDVNGILIERYMAGAYYNQYIKEGLELGTMLKYPYHLGMIVPGYVAGHGLTCTAFKDCIKDILKENQIVREILTDLSKSWESFKKTDSNSLFEDESFFYILIALFVALCVAGALWHYFVYLPNKRSKDNDVENGQAGNTGEHEEVKHIVLLQSELQPLCLECREKIEAVQKENPNRHFHNSIFPMGIPIGIGTPNLKKLSTNALGQLRNLPGNTVDQIGHLPVIGQRKRGRIT